MRERAGVVTQHVSIPNAHASPVDHQDPACFEWFERAAEVPAPSAAAGRGLMYDLANTLEKAGELSRALAVFVELEAEAGNYRDVAYKILRLSKLQAKE